MRSATLLALASAIAVEAANRGFNYGATNSDGSVKQQQDFENEFYAAQKLPGGHGFTSARLYTTVQGGTANQPTSAILAAINSKTGLLLGLWASAGQDAFNNELAALKSAISTYGSAFTSLVEGISVGSEDLYRDSQIGIINKSGIGASPDQLVSYISQLRAAIAGTALSSTPVGHVDTWTSWVNGSNSAVINAVNFLGVDGYPYFQNTQANGIENGAGLFFDSYNATVDVAQGKDVWITETGWPVSGPTENQAVASVDNAETYWQDVACRVLGNINTYWYTLQDSYPVTPAPSFGLVGSDINSAPLYDLTCKNGNGSPQSSSSSSSAVSSAASSVASSAASSAATSAATSAASSAASSAVSSAASSAAVTSTLSVVSNPTTASAAPTTASSEGASGAGGKTVTTWTTTLVTITSCPGSCSTAAATSSAAAVTSAAATTGSSAPSTSACPANLNGPYEYPHLIVPVDSSNPSKAYGTSYNGTITPTISSIFNFDIPASDAGKTCTLVFLFPLQSQLETSAWTFNGQGGLAISALASPATEQTTYATVPQGTGVTGQIPSLAPGNSYTVLSGACPAGQRVSYEFSSLGGLDLDFFQDYNPSPLGAYVTVC